MDHSEPEPMEAFDESSIPEATIEDKNLSVTENVIVTGGGEADEPKSKKAVLETLRNMKFAAKDPFKNNPLRDHAKLSLLSRSIRDRTPPPQRKSTSGEEIIRRKDRDEERERVAASGRRRRSRSRHRQLPESAAHSSANSLVQSRHQRSTMFFLQNEQKAAVAQKARGAVAVLPPTKPLKDRIESLFAKSDNEVFALPASDIKALILHGVELFREQEHLFLDGKVQLMKLDLAIVKEKEEIDSISATLPAQYRPPIYEEQFSRKEQQVPTQQQQSFGPSLQKPLNFSMPPPAVSVSNDFTADSFARPPPPLPPASLPLPGLPQFGQSPSLLYSKPPPIPTSLAQDHTKDAHLLIKSLVPVNTSIPPPTIHSSISAQELQMQHPKLAQLSTSFPTMLPAFFPPPAPLKLRQQEQGGGNPPPQMSLATSLHSQPPPQIMVSNSSIASISPLCPPVTSTTNSLGTDFSVPPPAFPPVLDLSKPPPTLAAQQEQFQLSAPSQQQQLSSSIFGLPSNFHDNLMSSSNFVHSLPQLQQMAAAGLFPHLTPPQQQVQSNMSPSVGSTTSPASPKRATTSSQSSTQQPRPLMSINFGLPPASAPSQRILQQQQPPPPQSHPSHSHSQHPRPYAREHDNNPSSAEPTQASAGGGRGRGRGRHQPLPPQLQHRRPTMRKSRTTRSTMDRGGRHQRSGSGFQLRNGRQRERMGTTSPLRSFQQMMPSSPAAISEAQMTVEPNLSSSTPAQSWSSPSTLGGGQPADSSTTAPDGPRGEYQDQQMPPIDAVIGEVAESIVGVSQCEGVGPVVVQAADTTAADDGTIPVSP